MGLHSCRSSGNVETLVLIEGCPSEIGHDALITRLRVNILEGPDLRCLISEVY